MSKIHVDKYNNSINLNKLRYDLSIIYTKHKYEQNTYDDTSPQCVDNLVDIFGEAYQQLCNIEDEYLIKAIDFTYECDNDD